MVLSKANALAGALGAAVVGVGDWLRSRLRDRRTTFTSSTARALNAVRLPDDELQHPGLIEWWYFKGHFEATATATAAARRYSFIAMVLKRDVLFVPAVVGLFRLTDHAVGPGRLVGAYSESTAPVDFDFSSRGCFVRSIRASSKATSAVRTSLR